MQVLILGMPRTGTQSLADALAQLGISPVYHMREVGQNGHQAAWIEAIEAKFSGTREESSPPAPYPWREKFDAIFDGFQAAADYPTAIFPAELMAAYPDAAVILTTRVDEEAWFQSMLATLIHAHAHAASSPDPSPMFPLAHLYHQCCWNDDFPTYGRAVYRQHNAMVREKAAALGRRFLEYETGSGWGPLCEFLGLGVPDAPYPRSDDWAVYKEEVQEREKGELQEWKGAEP